MRAVSLHQPWAELCVTRRPADNGMVRTDPTHLIPERYVMPGEWPMVKRVETRSWPCPLAVIGQRIAIHATKREPKHLSCVGEWSMHTSYYTGGLPQMRRLGSVVNGELRPDGHELGLVVDLPLGAIVGSAVIAASLPIVTLGTDDHDGEDRIFGGGPQLWRTNIRGGPAIEISDQSPYGDFTPGRWAWIIEDAAPTTERCPWCWGNGCDPEVCVGPSCTNPDHPPCPVCDAVGWRGPIPTRGHQRIWNWAS